MAPTGHFAFRRSLGNVGSLFRGARPDTYPLIDPDVLAFADESGATSLDELNDLVTYLKAEELYSDSYIIPLVGSQNAGSGTTLYALGGSHSTDFTLSSSSQWDESGMWFDGVNLFASGDIDGISSASDATVLVSFLPLYASEPDSADIGFRWSYGDSTANKTLALGPTAGSLAGETNGTFTFKDGLTDGRIASSIPTFSQGEYLVQSSTHSAGGTAQFEKGDSVSLNLMSGMNTATDTSPASTGYASDDFFIGSRGLAGTNQLSGFMRYAVIIKQVLTSVQLGAISSIITPWSKPNVAWWGDSLTECNHQGWTDSAATTRITPPAPRFTGECGAQSLGFGVAGETASQIATRGTASTDYSDYTTIIWAGTNDEDNADPSGVADSIQEIIDNLNHDRFVVVTPLKKASWTAQQKSNIDNIRDEYLTRWPSKTFDLWTDLDTSVIGADGIVKTGFLRYNSVATEDDLHGNDNFYDEMLPKLKEFMDNLGY